MQMAAAMPARCCLDLRMLLETCTADLMELLDLFCQHHSETEKGSSRLSSMSHLPEMSTLSPSSAAARARDVTWN